MRLTDKQREDLTEAIARAKPSGKIALDDVEAIDADATPEAVEDMLAELKLAGIEVVDDDEGDLLDMQDDGGPTNDPVRLYLRSIGRVPLLTARASVTASRC